MSRNGLTIALNDVWEHNSEEYRRNVLEIDDDTSIESFTAPLLSMPKLYNEFVDTLVQRIVYTQVMSKVYKNPLKVLEGDRIPLGYLGQEIFVNPAIGRDYDIDDFAGALKKYESDTKVQYQAINFDKQYPITIIRQKLKQAFVSWSKLEDYITSLTNSLYNGYYIDEYNNTKAIVTRAYLSNAVQTSVINEITTDALAREFVERARTYFLNFQTPSSDYNAWSKVGGYGRSIETFTNPEDIVFLIRNDIRSKLDVGVLANAFNIDKTTLLGNILPVNDFTIKDRKTGNVILDGSKIIGIICDKSWFRIKEEDLYIDDFRNANNRSINYYLNAIKMFNYSFFANAICFCTEEPVVTITGLTFGKTEDNAKLNEQFTLRCITEPANANTPVIEYTSSDDSIITVGSDSQNNKVCVVNPVGVGEATITAKAGNAECEILIRVTE